MMLCGLVVGGAGAGVGAAVGGGAAVARGAWVVVGARVTGGLGAAVVVTGWPGAGVATESPSLEGPLLGSLLGAGGAVLSTSTTR